MGYIALLGITIFVSMFVNGYQLIKHYHLNNEADELENEIKSLGGTI